MPLVSETKREVHTGAIEQLVYCHRRQGTILFRESNGQLRVLLGKNASEGSPQFFAPYGIAVDQGRHGFWISDKQANAVWFAKFSISDMGAWSYERFQFERFVHNAMRAPCMVDVHPSLGLLTACYGTTAEPGGLIRYDGNVWEDITVENFRDKITHCCWWPDGGYSYVTRSDSVLWHCEGFGAAPRALTLSGNNRMLSPISGPLEKLRLRYVQGLRYSVHRDGLLIADASLGAIYFVDLKNGSYFVVAGKPSITDSEQQALLSTGRSDLWLGPIRGITEDTLGRILILDGEQGFLYLLENSGELKEIETFSRELSKGILGTGMVVVRSCV